ncbi:hypothetical protein KPH14_001715 [Odynerus spinipes]|uniref:Uncharacterized protein n=1 Tax=Odynerus spinipes TaxID=1348599 RepID=A0AAD9VX50_9HYME|nr:hypothetical protein KPH14_001715 [Odynerus spinipes]
MPSREVKFWVLSLTLFACTIGWISSESDTVIGNSDGCGERLERALDSLQRDSNRRRNRLEDEESRREPNYREELRSAPLMMTISRIAVKFSQGARSRGGPWARVEKCFFEPSSNSLKTRVTFNDLSVSGTVSLLIREDRRSNVQLPLESCKMTLRLRQAGIDIFTGTIARARGQMRIRTESSFLEPRFASLYAYGCRPTRRDRQLKRQDKWPPYYPPRDEVSILSAEPRRLFTVSEDADLSIANESRTSRSSGAPTRTLGTWRNNLWITKSAVRRRRATKTTMANKNNQQNSSSSSSSSSSTEIEITPGDFATALINSKKQLSNSNETVTLLDPSANSLRNDSIDDCDEPKANFKRAYTAIDDDDHYNPPRESRETFLLNDENLYDVFMPGFSYDIDSNDDDDDGGSRSWQSREHIAREMEDIFLRGASRSLTSYIERQLHPAIKEALMLSMGYTISYG